MRLDPDHETARLGLADALTSLGRMDEASAVLRKSIRLRKAVGAAYNALANTQKFTSEPPELNRFFEELERGERSNPATQSTFTMLLERFSMT